LHLLKTIPQSSAIRYNPTNGMPTAASSQTVLHPISDRGISVVAADRYVCAEHVVPQTIGDAKITQIVEVMMECVAALQMRQVGRLDLPMMDAVVRRHIPKVSKHHARGEPRGDLKVADQDGRHRDERQKDKNAEPGGSADKRLLVMVMHVMLVLDPFDMMENVAVEQVFDKGPNAQAGHDRQDRRPPPMGIAHERQDNKADGGRWIGVEIGKEGGSAQSRGGRGGPGALRRPDRIGAC